jgi:uncharacterized protein (TIRG00374 family)
MVSKGRCRHRIRERFQPVKRMISGGGLLVSLAILTVMIWRLDWSTFVEALVGINAAWLVVAVLFGFTGLALRALRWNIVSGRPLREYSHFWRSAALGQLGNFIFPLRAGDILRMMSLNKFANVPIGQAVTSAVVDRVNDGFLLVVSMLVVLSIHGMEVIGGPAVISVVTTVGVMVVGAGGFVIWGHHATSLVDKFATRLSAKWADRARKSFDHMLEVGATFRRPARLSGMLVVDGLIVAGDVGVIAALFLTMGWDLPLAAALTTIVFLWAGISLPSAPGFIGIYQIACVLALGLYGIDEPAALAMSVILHLLALGLAVVQGGVATLTYGINLRQEYSQAVNQD